MIQLVRAGISEDVIMVTIRCNGIEARPSRKELLELQRIGASEALMATLLAAALLNSAERPPTQNIESPFHLWQPYPPLPGLVPIPSWPWREDRGIPIPRPERPEP